MSRDFVVTRGDMKVINLVYLIMKHIKPKPKNVKHKIFFVHTKKGKTRRV